MTIAEAAAHAGVTDRTIRAWVAAGALPLARTRRPLMVELGAVDAAKRDRVERRHTSDARGARAYAMHAAGHAAWADIADALGFTSESGAWRVARRWAERHGRPWPPSGKG